MANHVTQRERDALWQYAYTRVRINDKGEAVTDTAVLAKQIEDTFHVSHNRARGAVSRAIRKHRYQMIQARGQ